MRSSRQGTGGGALALLCVVALLPAASADEAPAPTVEVGIVGGFLLPDKDLMGVRDPEAEATIGLFVGGNLVGRWNWFADGLWADLKTETFAGDERDAWLEKLRSADVVCAPVQDYPALEHDPQVEANELIIELEHPQVGPVRQVGIPVKLGRTPGAARSTAPEHGQHTEEVLIAAGYSWDDIGRLREQGVL